MSKAIVTESKLTAIADAIRDRFAVSGNLTLDEMAETIMPSLPSDYQQVDYVQSSGTQYIDTVATGVNGVKLKMQIVGTPADGDSYFGAITSNTSNRYDIVYYGGLYFGCGSGDDSAVLVDITPTDINEELIIEQGVASSDLKVNGTVIKTFAPFTNSCSHTIKLFARHNATTGVVKGSVKIFECKLYKDQTLVRNMIPCYRKSDNVIGMYDVMNSQFYTNAGSGTFTCYPAPPA